jgi:hypothetical protein
LGKKDYWRGNVGGQALKGGIVRLCKSGKRINNIAWGEGKGTI